MKSDVAFALENAGWPALLMDGAGTICRANAAAISIFGAALGGEAASLSVVWAPENSSTVAQFLAQWERSAVPMVLLKFRGKGGHTLGYLSSICAFAKDGQKYFVLQLLREGVAGAAEAPGQALKQKLDCALQLARTVALDFNNALTSILGHTSLVLSRMEPNHPWRESLIEVEKSASKAAEIANDLGTFSRQEKEARAQAAGNLNLLLQRSVEFFQQNAGPEPVAWKLQLDRKLFAAKFDEAKMQQAFMKILENALQALRRARPHHRANAQHRTGGADAGPQRAPGRRRVCMRRDHRQRLRHRAGCPAAGIRALLHDQARRQPSRAGSGLGLWHRHQSRRRGGDLQPARRGHLG